MYDLWPNSQFFPDDDLKSYWIYRDRAGGRDKFGPYRGVRSTLQGNASYGQAGISEEYEERVNLPMDSAVNIADVLVCLEDGQAWKAVAVRRQAGFRVAYLQRTTYATPRAGV